MNRLWQWYQRFRRKFWKWVLRQAEKRLPSMDLLETLDKQWWDVVRYRMKELGRSDLGLNTVELLFIKNEGDAVDSTKRDMRDIQRDIRSDRSIS